MSVFWQVPLLGFIAKVMFQMNNDMSEVAADIRELR
jgi:hypothetical protein